MILELKKLKYFLSSIKDKKINQIYVKKDKLSILINKQLNNNVKYLKLKKFYNQRISNNKKSNQTKQRYIYLQNKLTNKNHKKQQLLQELNISQDESKIYSTIISPMVGTFYESSAPNEPAFVKKNEFVKKQQTVCIIEAMKLMNEIESEVNGEIIEILVKDGDIVDCGQALMKVKLV